jgi:hypothetical protein
MNGEVKLLPAWKQAAATLFDGRYNFGDVVSHEVIREALDLPKPQGRVSVEKLEAWRLNLLTQMDALSDWLLKNKLMCLRSIPGEGYLILKPAEQTRHAVKEGHKSIKASLRKMDRQLNYIDREQLTSDEARENADELARNSFLRTQFKNARRIDFDEQKSLTWRG